VRKTGARGIAAACCVWLLVGAAVNVALAWGIAMYESSRYGTVARHLEDGSGKYLSGPWPSAKPAGWPDDPNPPIYQADAPWITCRMWVTLYPAPDGGAVARSTPSRVQRWDIGWPLKSMAWEVWTREMWGGVWEVVPRSMWREGMAMGTRTNFGVAMPRVPLMADWPRLAASAMMWGGAFWLVSGGVRRWRRAWRRERGRCVRCGYDRRGLPASAKCPECGTLA
jgi:hypothetical protein